MFSESTDHVAVLYLTCSVMREEEGDLNIPNRRQRPSKREKEKERERGENGKEEEEDVIEGVVLLLRQGV